MEDGFQILIYVGAFFVWIVSSILKAREKAKPKRNPMPMPTVPTYSDESTEHPIITEMYEEEKTKTWVQPEKRKERTSKGNTVLKNFLSKNPYRESIEYRKKRESDSVKKQLKIEEKDSELRVSEIDWKKAVVYSEILRPRF